MIFLLKQKNINKKNNGFLVIEILIAVSIITISIFAAMSVSQKSVAVGRQAVHTTEATFLLEEGAEVIRMLRDSNWTNISSLVNGTNYYPTFSEGVWTLSSTPNTVGMFTRTVSIASVNRDNSTKDISTVGTDDPGTKLVTVTVSWLEGAITVTKNLQFYIIDIFS